MTEPRELLERNLLAAERVADRLRHSIDRLADDFPITGQKLDALDEETIEATDAFIKRFEQLQDAIANRVFRGIAILEQEDVSTLSRRDLALLMEKLGAIPSADEWARLSILRNQLAHEYPDEPDKQAARLSAAYTAAPRLVGIAAGLRDYVGAKQLAESGA